MLSKVLIIYALSAFLGMAAIAGALIFMRFNRFRLSVLNMLLGVLIFVLLFVGMTRIFRMAFVDVTMIYMDLDDYKILITALFLAAVAFIRYLFMKSVYFNHEKSDAGVSLLAGYGSAGAFAAVLYTLFMFVSLTGAAINSRLLQYNSENSRFEFENSMNISIIEPLKAHLLIAAMAVAFLALQLLIGLYMHKCAVRIYKWYISMSVYLLLVLSEIIVVELLIYGMQVMNYIAIMVICILFLMGSVLAVLFMRHDKAEEEYKPQFQ